MGEMLQFKATVWRRLQQTNELKLYRLSNNYMYGNAVARRLSAYSLLMKSLRDRGQVYRFNPQEARAGVRERFT